MFDVDAVRRRFPALGRPRDGRVPAFFDGPGGTQVPQSVVDAMVAYLTTCNANHGGGFATSRESDAVLAEAHRAAADLVNAPSPDEIFFGPNMTTLTLALSRAMGRVWKTGDEIVVTRQDHDANVTPWVLAARDAGATVRWVDVRPEDGSLDLDGLGRQLGPRTRLVAVACASNALGTVNDVAAITRWAHEAGAWVFLDAVHFAPHGLIDVRAWGCDFLACSAYKFFGPHVGILWGRRELLEALPVYKLRPVPERLPARWMTGTQNHEGLAGTVAAVDYLAGVAGDSAEARGDRRSRLCAAMATIRAEESRLGSRLLRGLAGRRRIKVWGVADPAEHGRRVPTVSVTVEGRTAGEVADHLARRHIYVWSGNMYALGLAERLGVEERGGFLRIGLVHYNTAEEVDRLLAALDEL